LSCKNGWPDYQRRVDSIEGNGPPVTQRCLKLFLQAYEKLVFLSLSTHMTL
jgi:hypothetical protein